ncbi:MAG: selenocysteine-specific translation elongation factor [Chloroflexi bacterium]|nr:selenocysteine-specific translation elongation factor [Chloroflexota bacterium]
MSIVIGTAGHIDHGKTTLLRAITGIDADRLPEERRRGMTIDVGYAHLVLPDGSVLDFVDVPGHDRLVGNMLVGAGEIDAALVVVAADDGPNAQTIEHLELLDALGIRDGVVAVTKADMVAPARVAEVIVEVEALVERTSLTGVPVVVVSAVTGEGVDALRGELEALRDRVAAAPPASAPHNRPRLAIDRVFAVRGRGTVVTGSLRGGRVAAGDVLRLLPDGLEARVREVQVRGATVDAADGGRTALLVGGVEAAVLRRGQVLATDPAVVATSRVLVAIRAPAGLGGLAGAVAPAPGDRDRLRLHLGTDQAAALVVRGPREAIDLPDGSLLAILRLDAPIAAAAGDRFALRRPSPGSAAGGGVILDPTPPRGVARRRLTAGRAASLAAAVGDAEARLELHGAVRSGSRWGLAPDVTSALVDRARAIVAEHHRQEPASPGISGAVFRQSLAIATRRLVTVGRAGADEVARQVVEDMVIAGVLARDGETIRDATRAAGLPPETLAAMDRLETALSVAAPPSLAEASRAAGCPPDGVRALEATGRIVRLEDDMAWAAGTYRDLVKRALAMAATAPLTPAAYRDATGSSRKFVMVILEDLDRRGLLRRTDVGHVLGPKTIARMQARAAAANGEGS